MNDELTPDERSALRARIVGGAHDIKPVGAHRNAWIAGSLAAVLVVAIAGGVAATTTLSAPEIATTPSPSPTATMEPVPTPTQTPSATPSAPAPTEPVVAFQADCERMLTPRQVSDLLGGGEAMFLPVQDLATNAEDTLARLGGLSCSWMAGTETVTVVAAAVSAVDPDLVASSAQMACDDIGCMKGRSDGDLWVAVQMAAPPSDSDRIDAVIDTIMAAPHVSPVPSVAVPTSGAWRLTDCAGLQQKLEDVTGEQLTQQFPDGYDPLNGGVIDRLLSSSAAVTGCAFHSADQDSRSFVTVQLTPGVNVPSRTVLDSPLVSETDVRNADRAWTQAYDDHVYDMRLAAVSGNNRLAVHRMAEGPVVTDAEQIAAAVIDFVVDGP